MELKPKIIDFSQINGGNEYADGDGVGAEAINGSLEASAYAQALATNGIDTTNIESGAPRLYIKQNADGTPQIVAEGLKGQKGDSGISNATLSNEFGESSENGYTQSTINSIIYRPNIIINSNFKVNQRGKTEYSGNRTYCVDRWIIMNGFVATPTENGLKLKNVGTTYSYADMVYYIDNSKALTGKKLTLSLSINDVIYKKTYNLKEDMPIENIVVSGFGDIRITYSSNRNLYGIGIYDTNSQNPNRNENVINWVKLEIGEIATQYVPPLYEEELLKCQYFYKPIFIDGLGYSTSDNLVIFSVPVGNIRNSFTLGIKSAPNIAFTKDAAPPVFRSATTELKHQTLLMKITTQIPNLGANNVLILSNGEAYIDAEIY